MQEVQVCLWMLLVGSTGEMVTAPENLPSCIYGLQLNLKPSWEGVLRKGVVPAFNFLGQLCRIPLLVDKEIPKHFWEISATPELFFSRAREGPVSRHRRFLKLPILCCS